MDSEPSWWPSYVLLRGLLILVIYTSMFYSLETLARNGDSFSITTLIFSAHHGIIRVFKFVYTTRSTRRIRSLAFAVVCLCPRKNYDSQRTEPISYSSLVDILKFWKFRVISFRLKFASAMYSGYTKMSMTRTLMKRWSLHTASSPWQWTNTLRQRNYYQGNQGSESCLYPWISIIRPHAKDKLKHGG